MAAALTALFLLGLLLGSTVLAARGEIYTAFVSVGYPMAFGLFPARWSVFAVAANAIVPLLAQTGFGPSSRSPVWVLLVSVAGPLLYAAWFVGAESERRRRANAELAHTNEKPEQALEENAGPHAQLLRRAREAGVHDERQRMAREFHDTWPRDSPASSPSSRPRTGRRRIPSSTNAIRPTCDRWPGTACAKRAGRWRRCTRNP